MRTERRLGQLVVIAALMLARAQSSSAGGLDPATSFYVPKVDHGSQTQFASLTSSGDKADAALIEAMVSTPQAVWFTGDTPHGVQQDVKNTVSLANAKNTVSVLVAYNVPYRDCAQYSAGGAADTASYEAWIDGFAAGIGNSQAVVILEPDSLGIIPYNTTIYGATEWCQPTVTNADGSTSPAPGASPTERYKQINYAVDSIKAKAPNALVYLDGTHSAWLGVGEAAYRLYTAGVQRSQGFFVNVSNYQTTSDNTQFATWVSDCITAATAGPSWAAGHFGWCPSQYNPAKGYALDYSAAYAATVTAGLGNLMGGAKATTEFVIDTSRNANGPLNAGQYANPPYNQTPDVISGLNGGNWCNPPGAGLGLRPTANTGVALLDAYLWVKIPGESDGQCDSAGGARAWNYNIYNPWNVPAASQSGFDPLWGMVDPAAGAWFSQQALQLAQLASPPLVP